MLPSRVTAHGPREGADDREDTPDRPQGQGGGQEGTGGRGKGVQVGVRLVLVSMENINY